LPSLARWRRMSICSSRSMPALPGLLPFYGDRSYRSHGTHTIYERRSRLLKRLVGQLVHLLVVGDDGIEVALAVALDDDFRRDLDLGERAVVLEERLLLALHVRLVLDGLVDLDEQAGLLVEVQEDVAVALVRHAHAVGRLVVDLLLGGRGKREGLVGQQRPQLTD